MVAPLVTAGLIGAGASLVNGALGFMGGQKSSDISAQIARENLEKQLAWEKERATNAYQWAADDLEKAGLNKNLLNMHAGAAVTGSLTPQMPDTSGYQTAYNALGNMMKDGITTALGIKTKLAEIKNINAMTNKADSESALNTALAATEAARKGLISKQTEHEIIKIAAAKLRQELDEKYSESERLLGIGKTLTGMTRDILSPLAQLYGFGKLSKGLKMPNEKPFKGYKMNGKLDIYDPRNGEVIW